MAVLTHLLPRQDPIGTPPGDPNTDPNLNPDDNQDFDERHGVTAWGWFLLGLFILVVIALVAWLVYSRLRARRLGLPPPSLNPFSDSNRIPSRNYPATGGPIGWVKGKWRNFRSGRRVAGGGYESTGHARARRNQFGALDPDEAWDARVGHEADEYGAYGGFEEQELGLATNQRGRADARGYGPSGGVGDVTRGRSPSRELDDRYDEAMGRDSTSNPFGDGAERSQLRGISPRPHDESTSHSVGNKPPGDSPTSERRSVFRENV